MCRQITDIWCRAIYLDPDAPMPAAAPAPKRTR
jgi:hypothetical protein